MHYLKEVILTGQWAKGHLLMRINSQNMNLNMFGSGQIVLFITGLNQTIVRLLGQLQSGTKKNETDFKNVIRLTN